MPRDFLRPCETPRSCSLFFDLYDIRNIAEAGATAARLSSKLGINQVREGAGLVTHAWLAVERVGPARCGNIIRGCALRNDEPGIHGLIRSFAERFHAIRGAAAPPSWGLMTRTGI